MANRNSTKSLRPSLASFLLMMAMALTSSALSFFVTPVCESLQVGRGSFTLYYSLMTVAGAFSASFLGSYINKHGVRRIMLLTSFWCSAGMWLYSISTQLWMFYATALCMGLFATSCVSLCANVIVQQAAVGSSVVGLVMAGSGVGGMICSVVVPTYIEKFGWQNAFRFLGICWLVLVLLAYLILGKQNKEGNVVSTKQLQLGGMSKKEALKSRRLYLVMVMVFIMSACCGIQQQLPSILGSHNFTTVQISTMMTVMTAALALGKIFQGVLFDKLGVIKGGYVMLVIYAVSFWLLRDPKYAYPGLVALSFGMGTVTTMLPVLARYIFGIREFAAIWSILSVVSSCGSFAASPIWGMVYDATGSYDLALAVSPFLLLVTIAALWLIQYIHKRSE